MKGQGSKREKSFEAALERLQEIVSEMEQGELKLDALLKKFEEGMRLAQFCSRKLEEAEKKIEVLIKKEDGSFETEEFLPAQQEVPDERSLKENLRAETEAPPEEATEGEEPLF